jgi:Lar family restriction alleviation protein
MSEKLKPCPFCGGSEILSEGISGLPFENLPTSWVICETCGVSTNEFSSSKKAEAAWNLRTPIEEV